MQKLLGATSEQEQKAHGIGQNHQGQAILIGNCEIPPAAAGARRKGEIALLRLGTGPFAICVPAGDSHDAVPRPFASSATREGARSVDGR